MIFKWKFLMNESLPSEINFSLSDIKFICKLELFVLHESSIFYAYMNNILLYSFFLQLRVIINRKLLKFPNYIHQIISQCADCASTFFISKKMDGNSNFTLLSDGKKLRFVEGIFTNIMKLWLFELLVRFEFFCLLVRLSRKVIGHITSLYLK